MKRLLMVTCAAAAISVLAERVPEYDSQYTAASGYVTLTSSDGSTTSSWDTVGYWSDKAVPHSTTNYYVGSARTLNVKKNTSGQTAAPFGGAKLVVAGKLMDYGSSGWHTQLGDAIVMLPGSEYAMSSAGHVDSGGMEILGTKENPVQITFSNSSSYNKNMLVAFKLERERCLEFYSSKTNVTYYMLSSLPDALGTIWIDDHVTLRWSTTMDLPGTVDARGKSGGITLAGTSGTSTVGSLSLAAGAQLYLSGTSNTHVLNVTNRLCLAPGAIVTTDKFRSWSWGTPPVYPTIRLSAEAVAAGLPDLDKVNVKFYSLSGRLADGILPQLRLVSSDTENGGKAIGVSYYEVVSLTNKMDFATTPFMDRTSSAWTEANEPTHFWSDGSDPSPEKDYYVTDSYGVIFRASRFNGHALVLKGTVYFNLYGNTQWIPLIATAGSSKIRLRNSNPGFNAELDGTIRVEGTGRAYGLMFSVGDRDRLKVKSAFSGSSNVALLLDPMLDTDVANWAGTIEFSGDNSAFTGRIIVNAGTRGDFASKFDSRGYATWEPSAVSNVTLEVSDKSNLGGTLPSFTFDALAVSNECRLVLKETSTFDEMSRGWLFAEKAYLKVPEGKNATVKNTITYGTELVKEGDGTLTLASAPKFFSGGDSVSTPNGAKITVAAGKLGVATADALDGLEVDFAQGTGLSVPIEGVENGGARGVDLTNVAIVAPQGLAVYLDTAASPERPDLVAVTPVCTLPDNSPLLGNIAICGKAYSDTKTRLEQRNNGDGTVTVKAVTVRVGFSISFH